MDKKLYEATLNNIPLHVIITNVDGVITFANKEAEKITGYSKEEMIGKTPKLWGGLMGKEYYENLWQTIKNEKETFSGIIKNKKKNGKEYSASIKVAPIIDSRERILGFCGIEQELSSIQEVSDDYDRKKRYDNMIAKTARQIRQANI